VGSGLEIEGHHLGAPLGYDGLPVGDRVVLGTTASHGHSRQD
jgi:hypothetical protein